jgi:hypothetical protein
VLDVLSQLVELFLVKREVLRLEALLELLHLLL